ncbi:hypothetical protein ABEY41_20240 [Peribacillus butanolivorans]|uniref:VOC family protein n=1 Tax=Peribacillus butanolivorans TaxID=421767 RepID=UPI003D2E4763
MKKSIFFGGKENSKFLLHSRLRRNVLKLTRAETKFVVDSIQEAKNFLEERGAVCLTEPRQTPGSWIMFVKHPDGSIAEYVQPLPH